MIINVDVTNLITKLKQNSNINEIEQQMIDNIEIILTTNKKEEQIIKFLRTKYDGEELGTIKNGEFKAKDLRIKDETRIYYVIHFLKAFLNMGKTNKIYGHLAMIILKKYLENIEEYKGRISEENAYIKGCHLEWDLLVLKENVRKNVLNIYNVKDVESIIEVKSSGLFSTNLEHTFAEQLNEIEKMNEHSKEHKINYIFV